MSETSEQPPPLTENVADESWVPKVDMVFDSDEKAYQFYCLYAKEMGFGVRKHYVKRRSSGLVYSRVFCCYKEGFCRTIKEGKKPRPDARTGCGAHITVRIMDDGKFRVSEFEPHHNHELVAKPPKDVTEQTNVSTMVQKDTKKIAYSKPNFRIYLPSKSMNASNLEGADMRCMQQRALEGQIEKTPLEPGAIAEDWVPRVDMEFEDDEEAYHFYFNYAIKIGFSVRKHLVKRRASGLIYSRTYCCHKEGHTRKRGEQVQTRNPKPYDRTGCLASMTIKITKNGRYRVTEFEPKHNHALVIPSKAHLFKWQWRRGFIKTQDDLVDSAVDQRVNPEGSNGQMTEEEEHQLPPFAVGCKNYIPSKRMNAMMVGDAGAVLQYMQEKQAEDPSFYYALQLDRDSQLTNVFWTDGKSKADFDYFGDVMCFDTSYETSAYGRPFAPFIGVNHHKQAIIFGQALLYDETMESFRWLLEAFRNAMCGKQAQVILTDRSEAISNAIAAVWPGTAHRLCVWQLYNNASKQLNFIFQSSTTFAKDFSRCLYEIEEEEQFLTEWKSLLEKYDLSSNAWLAKIYEDKEKWSLAYGRQTFSADIKSTQIKESMNPALKEHLDSENLLDFFKHYENTVNERRHAELQADVHAHQGLMKSLASRMLRQAANEYTPAAFKVFQAEFDLSMDFMVFNCGQVGTMFVYRVTSEDHPTEYTVRFDSSNGTIFCSCKKFEFTGIQCRHVLKVLDIVNIKELPPQYILKRWTKDAKIRILGGTAEHTVNVGGNSSIAKRYSSLCCLLDKVAVRAAETVESHSFIENLSDQLMDQVCKILQTAPLEKPEDN